MAEQHFTEIEWTQDTHKSYDRVIQSWDGTRIMGDMVETMLPKFRYTQTNGVDGVKYYTDQDNPPYVTSVYGGGEEGVKLYTDKIGAELADTMAMCGAGNLSDINEIMVRLPAYF